MPVEWEGRGNPQRSKIRERSEFRDSKAEIKRSCVVGGETLEKSEKPP